MTDLQVAPAPRECVRCETPCRPPKDTQCGSCDRWVCRFCVDEHHCSDDKDESDADADADPGPLLDDALAEDDDEYLDDDIWDSWA